jgi:hypothetical protein
MWALQSHNDHIPNVIMFVSDVAVSRHLNAFSLNALDGWTLNLRLGHDQPCLLELVRCSGTLW